jgi:hypothetical protein
MVRLLTLSGLILLLAAPTASAGVREKILRECQDGRITGHYTPKQLRDARNHIPTDVDEYSDCRDVLAQATLTGHGGRKSRHASNAPGGVQPSTGRAPLTASDPVESQTLNNARLKSEALPVGDQSLIPGATGFNAAVRHELPTPVLVALILLGLCASAATFASVRRRVLARRQR